MADKAQSPGEGSDTWDIIEFELHPFVSVTLGMFFLPVSYSRKCYHYIKYYYTNHNNIDKM